MSHHKKPPEPEPPADFMPGFVGEAAPEKTHEHRREGEEKLMVTGTVVQVFLKENTPAQAAQEDAGRNDLGR
ncbi:MAG: hypothetical protein ABI565_09465 [Vicinamibacteria bacterium]